MISIDSNKIPKIFPIIIAKTAKSFKCAMLSIAITEELGDYNPDVHVGDYVSSLKLALRQTDQLERKVIELHKKREPGQDVQIVVDEFLSIARGLGKQTISISQSIILMVILFLSFVGM